MPTTIQTQNVLTDTSTNNISTKSLPTASFVKNIENDSWTKNYTFYDTKARAIGTYSKNHLGGYTKTETLLDFAGVPQNTYTYHKRLSTDTEIIIKEKFEYDLQNRLVKHWHNVNNAANDELLTFNEYNELGQVKNKKVGGNATKPLQTVDYNYNIRGWMTKINDPTNLGTKLFGYEVKYHNPTNSTYAPAKYNGNISEIDWKTSADGILKRYGYQYDNLNRLLNATFQKPNATTPVTHDYDEVFTYDLNGNILYLNRYQGSHFTQAERIDQLAYTYIGNQLQKVIDATANFSGYPVGGNLIMYDANGNMIKHPDKNMKILYNYLNLPNNIGVYASIFDNSTTLYTYRADEVKVSKIYNKNGMIETNYLDGFQYDNRESYATSASLYKVPSLKFVQTSEGYYDFTKNSYIYNYVDHLGNIRVSYTKNSAGVLEILEENNYYPFGLKHQEGGLISLVPYQGFTYNYKYNGKELQETGMYDYGARFYMPDIGRWGVVDPLAEVSRRWSPYNYVLNNPISHIDPDGRLSQSFIDELWKKSGNNTTWTNDGSGNFSDGNGNSVSDSGPGPKGSWGGVSWSGFINNANFEDGVEFYQINIRARVGTLKSVNGNATLNVKQTTGQWDKEYGWMPCNRTNFLNENAQYVTNCYGYVLTNGYFFVDDTIENIRNFLLDSGYKSAQATGKSFKVGDILLWDGHMIEATGKKNGSVVWSSYFGFDSSPVKGSLQEVMNYNKGFGRDYGSLEGATLYRQQDQSKIQFGQKKYEAVDVKTIQQQKNNY